MSIWRYLQKGREEMNGKINIVLTGVGGQGIVTAANIIGKTALKAKKNIYTSEIHGIAQRGGAVSATIRMGNVSSPLIAAGTADVILSIEPVEALRHISYANKNTKVITDINPVVPFTVAVCDEEYPDLENVFKEIRFHAELYKIDALTIAKESGDVKIKNIVMLGALAATGVLPFKSEILLEAILDNFPLKYNNIVKKMFEGGMNYIEKY
jgi:indolepyruvate ferredoxin oxidoreductase beta subunit